MYTRIKIAREVSSGILGSTPAGYRGNKIRRELVMVGAGYGGIQIRREPNLVTYHGQTLESRRALRASALLTSQLTSEAHDAHAGGSKKRPRHMCTV